MYMKLPSILFDFFISGRIKRLWTVLVPLVVVACSDVNTNDVGVSPNAQQGVVIPDAVRRLALEVEGTLTANLYCGRDSTGISIMIFGDNAQGTCANMSTAVLHEISVEFVFDPVTFSGTYVLAVATDDDVSVDPDGTDFSFEPSAYSYPDDNNNGVTNYQDLIDGRDPAIPPCKFGLSRIGQCVL